MKAEDTFMEQIVDVIVDIADSMDKSAFFKPLGIIFDIVILGSMALAHTIFG